MSSKIEIANKALQLIGANTIVNLVDNSQEAKAIINTYNMSLRSILAECPWNFATKRVNLVKLDLTPAWIEDGMSNYFKLPSDYIRIFKLSDRRIKWAIEGDKLLCNSSDVGIAYTYLNENTSAYSPSFVEAFAVKLAYDICYELTNSTSKQSELLTLYKSEYLPLAKGKNAQEQSPDVADDSAWVESTYTTRWG